MSAFLRVDRQQVFPAPELQIELAQLVERVQVLAVELEHLLVDVDRAAAAD